MILLLAPLLVRAEPATLRELASSDGDHTFRAYILPVNNEERIAVRRYDPRDLAEFSLLSKDGQSGGHVEKIAWSQGGKFLVFSTSSSGGHSPWNFRTYVFSTANWAFLCLDDVLSPVVSPDFAFADPSHLEVQVLRNRNSSAEDREKRVVDLGALPWQTPR